MRCVPRMTRLDVFVFAVTQMFARQTVVFDVIHQLKLPDRHARLQQEQAQTDPLTGAFNRRAYAGAAQREMCLARVSGQPLSFVMLDLDHFKRVNDTFGHATGDAALVSTANLCREVLRESDIFGRLGGEEFILIMPGTDQDQARAIAETIRSRLAGSDLVSGSHCVRLTATLAVTQFDASDEDLDDVLRRADAALYAGKNAGRDRVEAVRRDEAAYEPSPAC